MKSATNRMALWGKRVTPLAFVVLCATTLTLAVLSAPAYASRANEQAVSSMSASSSTPGPESEVLARSAAEPIVVKFKNRLTEKCLSTNFSNSVYTATCSTAEGQEWDIAGTTIKSRLTGKCLSTNYSYSVYTATCSGAEGHNWTIFFTAPQVKNGLTGKCLSTNFSYSAYTATCSTAEGQKWDLYFV